MMILTAISQVLTFWSLRVSACVVISCSVIACVAPITTNDPLISKYETAACVPPSSTPKVRPRTREWDHQIRLADGLQVIVKGAQIPGGKVAVFYPSFGETSVAADPGDYIYPSDVRIDNANALLLVKARGLAGGVSEQTWLFEYDIRRRQILKRIRVKNDSLPPECLNGLYQQ